MSVMSMQRSLLSRCGMVLRLGYSGTWFGDSGVSQITSRLGMLWNRLAELLKGGWTQAKRWLWVIGEVSFAADFLRQLTFALGRAAALAAIVEGKSHHR